MVGISWSQNDRAFQIFDSKGKPVKYAQMESKALNNQIILFGEFHDNPISHWLQFELTKGMYNKVGANLILGFEMFEQDQQQSLNNYLAGNISDKLLKDSLRLWPNYSTDYAPLIDFAKKNNLKCIADNVQRKYANLLFRKGRQALDTLPSQILSQMASSNFEVDTNLSQYAALRSMETHMPPGMGSGFMLESQAFKDATMAKFICKALQTDSYLIHFNGAYHSDFHQGIMWYIQKEKPEIKILTISTVTQENIKTLDKEHLGRADFIICVPESMTRTH